MAQSGETSEISNCPFTRVAVRCWEGRNSRPFEILASWRFKVFLGSGLSAGGRKYGDAGFCPLPL